MTRREFFDFVPVKSIGNVEAVRRRKSDGVHLGQEHQKDHDLAIVLGKPEFGGSFDGVDGVAADGREPENARLRSARRQQVGRVVGRAERNFGAARNRPPGADGTAADAGAFHGGAKRVVRREKEPLLAARGDNGVAGADRQRPGVIHPMHRVGRAGFACEVGRGGGGNQQDLLFSRATLCTASATDVSGTSAIASTTSTSNQRRADR